tara:strand:- start:1689 stop:2039 length:351 start_codon:yes stop_codon:yes gene_type:complete
MGWQDRLRKDIVSHTAFTTGVEPKGAFKIDEKRIVEIIGNYLEEYKKTITPYHKWKDTMNSYVKTLMPEIKEIIEKSPNTTIKQAAKEVHTRKRFAKWALKHETTDRVKRLTRRKE